MVWADTHESLVDAAIKGHTEIVDMLINKGALE